MTAAPPSSIFLAQRWPRRARGLGCAVLAVVSAGWLASCGPKADDAAQAPPAQNVTLTAAQLQHIRLYTVTPLRFRKTIEASGVVDFDNDHATSVLAPFSGPVSRLLVSPGQKVRQGEVLATVESPDFSEAVGTYRKALVVARNARKLADVDKDLVQHNGVSQREYQQAQTDAAGADADRDAALQALVALKVDPQVIKGIDAGRVTARIDGQIRSPISGTVVDKLITPGELLQAGTTPSFTVADLSKVWVMAQVSGSDLSAVSVGDPVQVETGVNSATLSGTVGNVAAQVNPDTRAVLARVVVANSGGVLKKQMYVRVRIQSRQQSTGLLVPASAILRDDENLPFVYVAAAGGGFARRHVTLGYRTGDQFDITDGLKAGDRIVVDGAIFVQFMQTQ